MKTAGAISGPYMESTASSSTITLSDAHLLPGQIRTPSDADSAGLKVSGRIIHAVASDFNQQSALWNALRELHSNSDWENFIVAPATDKVIDPALGNVHTVPVSYEKTAKEFTEEVLNPLLNYTSRGTHQTYPADPRTLLTWWTAYTRYNHVFADTLASLWSPGDLIYVYTHELYLVPALLRSKLSEDAHIAVYLTSFPSSEFYRCSVYRDNLLVGLLGASVVVGRSEAAVRHFLSSCARILGRDVDGRQVSEGGRAVFVECVPLGLAVDSEQLSESVAKRAEQIKAEHEGKKIVVARERHGTGAVQQLRTWDWFLDSFPQWKGKVVLFQVLSGPETPDTKDHERQLIEQITEKAGSGSLKYCNTKMTSQLEYKALLAAADTGLVACTCDRINTTAFQFVVAQSENNAPVILGESMAAAAMLVDAVQVNPWDADSVVRALQLCLTMEDASRQSLSAKLYSTVVANRSEVFWWRLASRLVQSYVYIHSRRHATPLLQVEDFSQSFTRASSAQAKRIFMFDYDGTLTPIVRDPAAALPSPLLLRILAKLTSDPHNEVWIISGRDAAFLDKILGSIQGLGFSAEHGCFLKPPHSSHWINLAAQTDMREWQTEVMSIFKHFTGETQGSSIETKHAALTWHYRRADPDFGQVQAERCFEHLQATVGQKWGSEVEIMTGKKNVEVRPRAFSKGEIVRQIVQGRMPGQENSSTSTTAPTKLGFVACAGDDLPDEDMFRVLTEEVSSSSSGLRAHAYTVRVGGPNVPTVAEFQVADPAGMLSALAALSGESEEQGLE